MENKKRIPPTSKPIKELKGELAVVTQQRFELAVQLIDILRQVLGLNEVFDASKVNIKVKIEEKKLITKTK